MKVNQTNRKSVGIERVLGGLFDATVTVGGVSGYEVVYVLHVKFGDCIAVYCVIFVVCCCNVCE